MHLIHVTGLYPFPSLHVVHVLSGHGVRKHHANRAILRQNMLCMLFPQGKLYQHMLQVDDISSDVPLQLLAGGYFIGGYGIVSSDVCLS